MSDTITGAPSLGDAHEQGPTLDERMKAAGMLTVAEMMGVTPMTRWEVHAGMTDLDAFGKWLDRKVSEYLCMRAGYELGDKDRSDELYEWVVAHSAVFSSIRTNFKAAYKGSEALAQAVAAAREEGRVAGLAEAVAVLRGRAKSASFMEAYLIRIIAGEVSTLLSPPTPAQTDTAPGGRADG